VQKAIGIVALAIATVTAPGQHPSVSGGPQHLLIRVGLAEKFQRPASGRLLILLSKGTGKERLAFARVRSDTWVAAREVKALAPGAEVVIDADDLTFPTGFSRVPPGHYQIQAFLDVNHRYAYAGIQPGTLFSNVQTLTVWRPDASEPLALTLDQEVPGTDPVLPPGIEPIKYQSAALTAFWGRPIDITGYVVLPPSYLTSTRTTYPTVYWTHGFGGTPATIERLAEERYSRLMASKEIPEMIWVMLNESFSTGTVEFADSVNNGPWGFALTRELIPNLERQYRMDARPNGRFLTGHSSGGWATLWLQVAYPTIFGGTWSTAPDPSDFHNFTGPDIYAPHANVYRHPDGSPWMLMRMDRRDVVSLEDFAKIDTVLGDYGGQFASFEWVFSPKGPDGRPMPLFDRVTGDVDPRVAEYWAAHYDIARKITREWDRAGKDLRGKIHVIVGDADTYRLDESARTLEAAIRPLATGASFTYVPGKTHADLYAKGSDPQALTKEIAAAMYAIARPGK